MRKKSLSSNLILGILGIGILFLFQSCKKDPVPPVLTTVTVSSITTTSASSGGNISSDGGAEVTSRGICWSTSSQPSVTDSKTSDGKGTGSFTSSLTGLTDNTKYYVRAYAINKAGTSYGNEVSFTTITIVPPTLTTTEVTALSSTSAVSGGTISDEGGSPVTARGVCWSASANPTISGNKTVDGTGSGTFVSNVTELTAGSTYHLRAYATNSAGTSYGDEKVFTTSAITATLTTVAASNITRNSATAGGNITSDGGSPVTTHGVCWSTSHDPTTAGYHTSDGSGTGIFSSNLTGLTPNTTYYIRAYAINGVGTSYGNELSFPTSSQSLATISTTSPTNITSTTALSGGNISSDGGANVTARGVCWATTINPTISASKTTNGTGTGNFTSTIIGLQPGTTYHVRAYATNASGTAYGEDFDFTTLPVVPALTTSNITSMTMTSATSGGTITSSGGSPITQKGVCWSLTSGPTIAGAHTSEGGGSGSFSSDLSGLTAGTIYYVRAYATNSAGTGYGNELEFSTVHETGSATDVDGNTYMTIKIGNEWWFAENLKTTRYNDNTSIPLELSDDNWKNLTTPAYCWYQNNETANKNIYGAIYNWYAINTGKLCPTGWHVATDQEFKTLEMYLGMTQNQADSAYWRGTVQGTRLKSVSGWSNGGNGNNLSGFNAVPAGYRYYLDGHFYDQGTTASFLTATEHTTITTVIYRNLNSNYTTVWRKDAPKNAGKAVRCVID
jgi:uncharacterized protein (TIGR02145 family)